VPGNRIGPLLLVAGAMMSAEVALGTYATHGSAADPVWPATAFVGNLTDIFFIYPIVIVLIGVPLLFPDGHLPSRRFRWIAWLTIAALAAATASALFGPGEAGETGLENPFGLAILGPLFVAFDAFANLSAILGFGGAAVALWVRFHRGDTVVREQVKWLFTAAAVATVTFPLSFILRALQLNALADWMSLLAFLSFLAIVSVSLFVLNLLPIPILDGGHIFFALIEGVRHKPLSLKTQNFFQRVGLFVLVSLVVFSFYNDLSRVTQRRRAEADISKRLRTAAPGDTAAAEPRP
jgi:Zn-dependent protease